VSEPDLSSITPVAQDYLKVIWSATEWGDPPITTGALAARFGTSAPAVSDTLRRLAGQGLLVYEPYRPVRLSRTGERLAVAMVRRHRLLETFLAQVLGYAWDEVHDEAERLEHAVSEAFLQRIDALLGHPTHDPHGDVIPAPGSAATPGLTRLLSQAGPGRYRVVRVSDADPEALARLSAAGVRPGAEVDAARLLTDGSLHTRDLAAVRVSAPGPGVEGSSRAAARDGSGTAEAPARQRRQRRRAT
jgi:DtxR family Mn-dependent transcriptional regulator